ncbi:hypothetical protein FOZ60_015864 [Perkinsus olseni]|uniref:Uncharacterized protein n=1 Tax=Perkinsus olseni TaxID=32597 RepID=A0A7J6N4V7_PEROL|nr:hypothetical protein FOZ60_015864 [Perkinsus olseni]
MGTLFYVSKRRARFQGELTHKRCCIQEAGEKLRMIGPALARSISEMVLVDKQKPEGCRKSAKRVENMSNDEAHESCRVAADNRPLNSLKLCRVSGSEEQPVEIDEGLSLGVESPLKPSGVLPEAKSKAQVNREMEVFHLRKAHRNFLSVEADPETCLTLLRQEVRLERMTEMSLDEAQKNPNRLHDRMALLRKGNGSHRLIEGHTASSLNGNCHCSLPRACDISAVLWDLFESDGRSGEAAAACGCHGSAPQPDEEDDFLLFKYDITGAYKHLFLAESERPRTSLTRQLKGYLQPPYALLNTFEREKKAGRPLGTTKLSEDSESLKAIRFWLQVVRRPRAPTSPKAAVEPRKLLFGASDASVDFLAGWIADGLHGRWSRSSTDDPVVRSWVRRYAPGLAAILWALAAWIGQFSGDLNTTYIKSKENWLADRLSRGLGVDLGRMLCPVGEEATPKVFPEWSGSNHPKRGQYQRALRTVNFYKQVVGSTCFPLTVPVFQLFVWALVKCQYACSSVKTFVESLRSRNKTFGFDLSSSEAFRVSHVLRAAEKAVAPD